MSGRSNRGPKVQSLEPEQLNEDTQVLGKQIWRVVPYAKKYPRRVMSGILANMAARFFDLMPLVAIGFAVDYFTTDSMSGPMWIQNMVTGINSDPAIGYGALVFLGFVCLALFQGISEYSWANTGLQNSA